MLAAPLPSLQSWGLPLRHVPPIFVTPGHVLKGWRLPELSFRGSPGPRVNDTCGGSSAGIADPPSPGGPPGSKSIGLKSSWPLPSSPRRRSSASSGEAPSPGVDFKGHAQGAPGWPGRRSVRLLIPGGGLDSEPPPVPDREPRLMCSDLFSGWSPLERSGDARGARGPKPEPGRPSLWAHGAAHSGTWPVALPAGPESRLPHNWAGTPSPKPASPKPVDGTRGAGGGASSAQAGTGAGAVLQVWPQRPNLCLWSRGLCLRKCPTP